MTAPAPAPADFERTFREALRHGADPELHRYYLAGLGAEGAPPAPPRDYVERLFDSYASDFEQHLLGKLGYRAHHELVDRVRRCAGALRFEAPLCPHAHAPAAAGAGEWVRAAAGRTGRRAARPGPGRRRSLPGVAAAVL